MPYLWRGPVTGLGLRHDREKLEPNGGERNVSPTCATRNLRDCDAVVAARWTPWVGRWTESQSVRSPSSDHRRQTIARFRQGGITRFPQRAQSTRTKREARIIVPPAPPPPDTAQIVLLPPPIHYALVPLAAHRHTLPHAL